LGCVLGCDSRTSARGECMAASERAASWRRKSLNGGKTSIAICCAQRSYLHTVISIAERDSGIAFAPCA
jgi:hypothetical protein